MEYNWFAQLYWDCLYPQWGHDISQEITEACIHKQSAFEYRQNEDSGLLERKVFWRYVELILAAVYLCPDSFIKRVRAARLRHHS